MDRIEFGRLLDSVAIPKGTPAEEMGRKVLPIHEAISEMMPESLFWFRSCADRLSRLLRMTRSMRRYLYFSYTYMDIYHYCIMTKEEFEVFQLELQQSSMSIKENDIAGSNE